MKEFLSRKGVAFRELDVSRDRAAAQQLVDRTGRSAVPVIVVDGQTIVGFDRQRLELALARTKRQPYLGAAVADAGKVIGRGGTAVTSGAYVGSVKPGSLAQRMGLRQGDIITELSGQRIAGVADLEKALASMGGGAQVSLTFVRGNDTLTAKGEV